jgi:hypothetical protein
LTISRRKFFGAALTAGATGLIANADVPRPIDSTPDLLTIENEHILVAIDRNTGCVDRIESKGGAWKIRGAGMRLHVPAPEHRYHYLTERHTPKPRIKSDSKQATIFWAGFESERLGKLDIDVTETIRLDGAGIHFSYEIRNDSKAAVESYTYPRLRGIAPPAGDGHMRQSACGYSGMNSASLWPTFGNRVGYWGYDTPAQLRNLGTDIQFCLVLTDSHGIYFGYHDQGQKRVVQVCFALAPAYSDSFEDWVFDPSGKVADAAVSIDLNHLCFIQAGESMRSEALVVEPFRGSWHHGADIYKEWRQTWRTPPEMPKWAMDVHSWQQIQINSAEDRLSFPYKDLTKYAEACKRWGVKAIQLTGWQLGGQDRDFPSHDTDPRLGTEQDLKDAIAASRRMGVEIILFNKYAWADVTGPAYENEFKKFAVEDPYGNLCNFHGYNYDTPTQIEGINTRRGAILCQASPLWRKLALEEFRKSVALGASGILYDESGTHDIPYCFSKTHGHSIPGACWSGDIPLVQGFRSIVDPEGFLFAGESPYDLALQVYDLSYFRIHSGFVPFERYLDPFAPMLVAVTGWNDRHTINACLLYRFLMSYEPRNFHGELAEMPVTLAYGLSVDDLRRRYREWIWDAEFRDTLGAKVTTSGSPLDTYAVFRRKDGRRAVAMANMTVKSIVCEIAFDEPHSLDFKFISPEDPELKPWPGKLELAPGSAAVVLEG